MNIPERHSLKHFVAAALVLVVAHSFFAQTQTTGGIAGAVKDQNGSLLAGARVTATHAATGETRSVMTDADGEFALSFLSRGIFRLRVEATGFETSTIENVHVNLADVATVEITLAVAGIVVDPISVESSGQPVRTDNATLGRTVDARTISELPMPTRSFTQLITIVPGVSGYLNDPTAVGRNTHSVAVNGSRPTQNNFQINGVDVNAGVMRDLQFGDPAPESIAEVNVQTSVYDASFGRAGGVSVQVVTKSGTNDYHGLIYEYFGDATLNANDPFLKAAGQPRPVLSRNVYGGTLGGPLRKDRAMFFASFQGTRERNAASRANSLRTGVFIDERLTDDRSTTALTQTYGPVHPVSLTLLQTRLLDGRYMIPTPLADGFINFAEISRFKEEQFNANLDIRASSKNWISLKLFYSRTPTRLAFNQSNVPGFGEKRHRENAIASAQDVYVFGPNVTNEARVGFNFIRDNTELISPVTDSDVGIIRSTERAYPGLTRIGIGAFAVGAPQRSDRTTAPSANFTDTVSVRSGHHAVRLGGEVRYYQFDLNTSFFGYGSINFQTFEEFISGTASANRALIGNGVPDRALRTTDYAFFIHDDWKFSPKLTLNLGLRYELAPPFYDTRGRLATFDPALYVPRTTAVNGVPLGPPTGGIVQAGNVIPAYDHADIPKVGKRVVTSLDPNNFAPRVGLAWSPFPSDAIVFRTGYGIFYSRASFQYAILGGFGPPIYNVVANRQPRPIDDPFPFVADQSQFPGIFPGPPLIGTVFDRNLLTPYIHQFNGSLQFKLSESTVLETAYVGTRGLNLFRRSAINQAYLASKMLPIRNVVTGADITINTPADAQLRAPYQGVNVGANFSQNQTVAQSSYHSLQASLSHRLSHGVQFLASYTYSKSIDNASGVGGGSGVDGTLDPGFINETSFPDGDQRDSRSARGVSDFDRTHRLVLSYVWDLPQPKFRPRSLLALFRDWQIAGVVTWMSGLPINIRDSRGAELFFGPNGGGDRPNWAPGATTATAMVNIPSGYYFNPRAFIRSVLAAGQIITSSPGSFVAGPGCPVIQTAFCTDLGNVGRNPLRGPRQFNVDVALTKRIKFSESRSLDIRGEAFNLLNNVNFANPISNFNATVNGGSIDNTTGQITSLGNFGKIINTSNNPRIVQLVVKFHF